MIWRHNLTKTRYGYSSIDDSLSMNILFLNPVSETGVAEDAVIEECKTSWLSTVPGHSCGWFKIC
jgi:hypothetical protein